MNYSANAVPGFEFTPAEAAALANACLAAAESAPDRRRITVSAINKAIEETVVPARCVQGKRPRRYVTGAAILYVVASRLTSVTLPRECKQHIYDTLVARLEAHNPARKSTDRYGCRRNRS